MARNKYTTDGCFCPDESRIKWHRPLLIGCSGGGGHNAAIQAIEHYLDGSNLLETNIGVVRHVPQLAENRQYVKGAALIGVASFLSNEVPIISAQFKKILHLLNAPSLPADIAREVQKLSQDQARIGRRHYIDMILDVFPAGYEHAAIWDILQREDKIDEIRCMLPLRTNVDREHYQDVYNYFYNELQNARKFNVPYTEIISTQVMGLSALCDAAIAYNAQLDPGEYKIVIHQYLTDIPTEHASHFFHALEALSPLQRRQIILYGVNLEIFWPKISKKFSLNHELFNRLVTIDAKNNPMVRLGFKSPELSQINQGGAETVLYAQKNDGNDFEKYIIKNADMVASVMLGSQAGVDTVKYVSSLLDYGKYKTIFVFGGTKPWIKTNIQAIAAEHKHQCRIVYLEQQDDEYIAPIMTRSNLIITRSGGLSTMEQMALPHHNPHQVMLIHSKKAKSGEFTSGIEWEDGNAHALISFLKDHEKLTHVAKLSADRLHDQILKMANHAGNINSLDFLLAENTLSVINDDNSSHAKEDSTNKIYTLLYALTADQVLKQLGLELMRLENTKRFDAEFISALDALYDELHAGHPSALHIAHETIVFVRKLREEQDSPSQRKLDIIESYRKRCSRSKGFKYYAKPVALVVITAMGCVVGAALGISVGLSLAAFTGPVGGLSTLVGMIQGASLGAKIGLAAATAATGAGFGACAGISMFKKSKAEKLVRRVVETGKVGAMDRAHRL